MPLLAASFAFLAWVLAWIGYIAGFTALAVSYARASKGQSRPRALALWVLSVCLVVAAVAHAVYGIATDGIPPLVQLATDFMSVPGDEQVAFLTTGLSEFMNSQIYTWAIALPLPLALWGAMKLVTRKPPVEDAEEPAAVAVDDAS